LIKSNVVVPNTCSATFSADYGLPKFRTIQCDYYNQSSAPSQLYPSKTIIDHDDGTVYYLSMLPLATSSTLGDGLSVVVAAVSNRGLRLWTAQYDFPDAPVETPFGLSAAYDFNGAVQQLFAAFTHRVLVIASPTLAPFAVDKASGREAWRLSDPSGVSLLTACTQFAVRRNGSAALVVFGDCDGRM
jgi:hypothetical protein